MDNSVIAQSCFFFLQSTIRSCNFLHSSTHGLSAPSGVTSTPSQTITPHSETSPSPTRNIPNQPPRPPTTQLPPRNSPSAEGRTPAPKPEKPRTPRRGGHTPSRRRISALRARIWLHLQQTHTPRAGSAISLGTPGARRSALHPGAHARALGLPATQVCARCRSARRALCVHISYVYACREGEKKKVQTRGEEVLRARGRAFHCVVGPAAGAARAAHIPLASQPSVAMSSSARAAPLRRRGAAADARACDVCVWCACAWNETKSKERGETGACRARLLSRVGFSASALSLGGGMRIFLSLIRGGGSDGNRLRAWFGKVEKLGWFLKGYRVVSGVMENWELRCGSRIWVIFCFVRVGGCWERRWFFVSQRSYQPGVEKFGRRS